MKSGCLVLLLLLASSPAFAEEVPKTYEGSGEAFKEAGREMGEGFRSLGRGMKNTFTGERSKEEYENSRQIGEGFKDVGRGVAGGARATGRQIQRAVTPASGE